MMSSYNSNCLSFLFQWRKKIYAYEITAIIRFTYLGNLHHRAKSSPTGKEIQYLTPGVANGSAKIL